MQTTMKDDYDRHSTIQRSVVELAYPMLRFAAGEIKSQPAVTFVDYGCSEGANSVLAMDTALQALWGKNAEQPVSVIHNDQYKNNFNRLFQNLYDDHGA
ncbi:MAG TPA: hypothetical protein V6C72_13745, partial [Chroococcales cyanobacterium]